MIYTVLISVRLKTISRKINGGLTMETIGHQIRKYRVERGYTQEKLGQLIGVTSQAVSKWERGSVPDAELIPLIAQFARHQH